MQTKSERKKVTEHIDYDTSRNQTLTECANLVEKREAERAERIKAFSNEYDAIQWGHDGDCGANEVVSRFLEGEEVNQ